MKLGFFPKLALDAIRKNKRMYMPYLLTCIGMVSMTYIIAFLQRSPIVRQMRGGANFQLMMSLGSFVVAVFAAIFLFYTNSFLMRRRKHEFGLYYILGMDKFAIGRVLLWETLLTAACALGIGLPGGIVLSKLAELGVVNLLRGDVQYTLSVSGAGIGWTAVIFCVIFVLLLLHNLRQIGKSTAIALLHSETAGEKPPKANWVLGIAGVVLLAAAYYLAVTIRDPLTALSLFFVAVLLVIVGTYLLFVAGSVLLCRILQRNKRYYYRANHFVSVSSMAYRMKRNGAGLASICILATMVLVMISSTASLYIGSEDALTTRYPRAFNFEFRCQSAADMSDTAIDFTRDRLQKACGSVAQTDRIEYRSAAIAGILRGDTPDFAPVNRDLNADTMDDVYQFEVIPLSDYNRMTGQSISLASGEALAYVFRGEYRGDTLNIGGQPLRITQYLRDFPISGNYVAQVIPAFIVITPDFDAIADALAVDYGVNGTRALALSWTMQFNVEAMEPETQIAFGERLMKTISEKADESLEKFIQVSYDGLEANREDFFGTFGSLLFLGILLSIVFLLAAVLMIYYKQITEGYEDQARFGIMQKLGMTAHDIRRSINAQLLMVFALPLLGAGLHLAFAFPMIRKLLLLFALDNVPLYLRTTLACYAAFALLYAVVYRITSNAYYHIVQEN